MRQAVGEWGGGARREGRALQGRLRGVEEVKSGLWVCFGEGVVRLFRYEVRGEPDDGAQGEGDETGERINTGRCM